MNESKGEINQEVKIPGVIPEAGIITDLLENSQLELKDRRVFAGQIYSPESNAYIHVTCDIAKVIAAYPLGSKPFKREKAPKGKVSGLHIQDQVALLPSEIDLQQEERLTAEEMREIIGDGGKIGILRRTNQKYVSKPLSTNEGTAVLTKEEFEIIVRPGHFAKWTILWQVPKEKRVVFEQKLKEINKDIKEWEKEKKCKIETRTRKTREILKDLKELVGNTVNFYFAFFPEGSMRREVLSVSPSAVA